MSSLFSFRDVDDRSFPYLRGINAFFDLFDERNNRAFQVSGVYAIVGHIAVLFHDSTTLCLFDAVIAPFRLSDLSSRLLVGIPSVSAFSHFSVNNFTTYYHFNE